MTATTGKSLRVLVLAVMLQLLAATAHANVITAASASLSDVRIAVLAANSGDTVVVPPGSVTWNNELNITKGITLQGSGIGNTVITSSYSSSDRGLINYEPSQPVLDEPFRVAGFTFELAWRSCGIGIQNPSRSVITKIRVDHNRFHKALTGIYISAEMYGVIDSNVFYECELPVRSLGPDNPWYPWADLPVEVGTSHQVFIEDNIFEDVPGQTDTAMVVEAGLGGRYVFRHNQIINWADFDILDMHGNQDPVTPAYNPGGSRGTMCSEVYENTVIANRTNRFVYLRGGTAIIFNNTITGGDYVQEIGLIDEDGPSRFNYVSSYPGYDIIKDTYIWNNVYNGSLIIPALDSPATDAAFIQKGRDYFTSAKPGYTPFTYPHPLRSGTSVPAPPTKLRLKD
jgi:hypothetical protein